MESDFKKLIGKEVHFYEQRGDEVGEPFAYACIGKIIKVDNKNMIFHSLKYGGELSIPISKIYKLEEHNRSENFFSFPCSRKLLWVNKEILKKRILGIKKLGRGLPFLWAIFLGGWVTNLFFEAVSIQGKAHLTSLINSNLLLGIIYLLITTVGSYLLVTWIMNLIWNSYNSSIEEIIYEIGMDQVKK